MESRYNLKEGDLVRWRAEGTHVKHGIVLDIYPRNVYENESCLVLCENKEIVIDSKFLRSGDNL